MTASNTTTNTTTESTSTSNHNHNHNNNNINQSTDKVRVAIRVRPFSRREIDLETKCVVEVKGDQTILHNVVSPTTATTSSTNNNQLQSQQCPNSGTSPQPTTTTTTTTGGGGSSSLLYNKPPKVFTFDNCFWSFNPSDPHFASQEDVFNELGIPILDSAFEGYNACIFAYGQTGSGKSYTMMGTPQDPGLIPRLCVAIFERMESLTQMDSNLSFKLEVSYMEIYNEKVHDLLVPANQRHSLKVREHNILGPYVDGLSTLAVTSYDEINNLMMEGNKSRTVAATNMNSESSRSHAVFTLKLTCLEFDPKQNCFGEKVSKMSLIDLAGSERAIKTGAIGDRLKEGSNINKSLTTLGLVISKLADQASGRIKGGREQFVPYRDSVLTWLLKDNLGGNSRTIMISTISPSADSYEETLSTLRYADRAKRIVNHAIINEDPNNRLIRELREEVEQLREQLLYATVNTDLKERLLESEKLIKEMEQTWEEKLRRTEKIHQERQQALEKMGISVQSSGIAVEKDRYYLVNLNADPSMNALLVYYLKDEITKIGRPDSEQEQDIQLSGVGIMPEHALIEIDKKNNKLLMKVINEQAITFVNGIRILDQCLLHNGDRILWGNNHFFSLNCPTTNNNKSSNNSIINFDYNYARDEMLQEFNPDLKLMFQLDHHPKSSLSTSNFTMKSSLSSSGGGGSGSTTSSNTNLSSTLSSSSTKREENFNLYLNKLRENISKANKLAFEANLISEEMKKQTEFKVTLQIPSINLNVNRLKNCLFISEPAILVLRKNFPKQIWSMEKFETNLIEMREYYSEWKTKQQQKNIEDDNNSDSTSPIQLQNDPFYELQERHLLIGVANIFLEVLLQDVLLDYKVPIISQQGEMVGRLHIEFGRIEGKFIGERIADASADSETTTTDLDSQQQNNLNNNNPVIIIDPKDSKSSSSSISLGNNQIRVRLQIKSASNLPKELSNFVFCQYTVCGLSELIVLTPVDTTNFINSDSFNGRNGNSNGNGNGNDDDNEIIYFNHQREFLITLTEEFLELCQDGSLSIEVWGHRISANYSNYLNNKLSSTLLLRSSSSNNEDFLNDEIKQKQDHQDQEEKFSKISKTLTDRWLELKRKLDLWIEIHELNDQGLYQPVEIQEQSDILTGGVYQLKQGQQRRILIRLETVPNSGTLPFIFESIRFIQIGCVSVRSKLQKSLDSYQETDLQLLNERWTNILKTRQNYLQEQLNDLINNKNDQDKTPEEIEREQRLMNQWVNLIEERKASKCPAPGSEIPGAPDDQWERPIGMEKHIPVIFLDLNTDELNLSNSNFNCLNNHNLNDLNDINDMDISSSTKNIAGLNSILPKEFNGTPFFNLQITQQQLTIDGQLQAIAVWDSSVHESKYLNRLTQPNERIFLILKICLKLTHPSRMDLILRKRIAINVFNKKSLVSSTKNIFKRISRSDLNPNPIGTGIRYEIVSSIPKASEDIEDRESLALLAASDLDLTACDGESYIERYTKSVQALESILTLDRLRQEVAVREQLAKKAKRALQLISTTTSNNNNQYNGNGIINDFDGELRKTLSVPNMAQFLGYSINNNNINRRKLIPTPQNLNINNNEDINQSNYSTMPSSGLRWTKNKKAQSFFSGSMSGGLNQLIVTDIDIGEEQQQQPSQQVEDQTNSILNRRNKSPKPIKSTSPIPNINQLRKSMCTLIEEQPVDGKLPNQYDDDNINNNNNYNYNDGDSNEKCFIKFESNSNSNNRNSSNHNQSNDDLDSIPSISSSTISSSMPSNLSTGSINGSSGDDEDESSIMANSTNNTTTHTTTNTKPLLPDWLQLGESVRISPDSKLGTIQFIGETRFAPGLWIGIELDTPTGKNDGTVDGWKYFQCKPKFGIFVKPEKLKLDPKGKQMRSIQQQQQQQLKAKK